MKLFQWLRPEPPTPDPTIKTREKELPDAHGDLLGFSMSGGKLYVAVEELRGPRVAVGPYSPAEVHAAINDLEREADTDAAARALYEAMPERLRSNGAGFVVPWELLSAENRAVMRGLATTTISAAYREDRA